MKGFRTSVPSPARLKRISQPFASKPPESKYLWHLFSYKYLDTKLSMFLKGGLWMARLDAFKDEFEGKLPQANIGLLNMLLSRDQADYTQKEYEHAARLGYASCWHMSNGDPDPEIWKRKFGNNHKGIALRTTFQELSAQLGYLVMPGGPGYISEVQYIDHQTTAIPEAQTVDVAFRVRREYAYQREARVYVNARDAAAFKTLPSLKSVWDTVLVKRYPGRQIPSKVRELRGYVPPAAEIAKEKVNGRAMVPRIDPEQLIHEILVGWRVNSDEKTKLAQMLAGTSFLDLIRYEDRNP
jgi:hypothetical protein